QVPGDPSGFDISLHVTNAGPSDLAGHWTATMLLPTGMIFSPNGPQPPPNCVRGHDDMHCDGDQLGSGSTATYTFRIETTTPVIPGNTTVSASVSTTGTIDPDPGNNTAAEVVPFVQSNADLALTMTGNPSLVAPGQGVGLTMRVENLGPFDQAGGFVVSSTLPASLTVGFTDTGCSARPGGFQCVGAGLAPGAIATFHVTAEVLAIPPSPVSITASVASTGTPDLQPANDTATVPVDIRPLAQLALTLDAPATDRVAGDPAGFDYAIGVTNYGPSDQQGGYIVQTILPAGVTFLS